VAIDLKQLGQEAEQLNARIRVRGDQCDDDCYREHLTHSCLGVYRPALKNLSHPASQTISGRAAQLLTSQRTIETDLGYIDVRRASKWLLSCLESKQHVYRVFREHRFTVSVESLAQNNSDLALAVHVSPSHTVLMQFGVLRHPYPITHSPPLLCVIVSSGARARSGGAQADTEVVRRELPHVYGQGHGPGATR
jgi:hypothetical protein